MHAVLPFKTNAYITVSTIQWVLFKISPQGTNSTSKENLNSLNKQTMQFFSLSNSKQKFNYNVSLHGILFWTFWKHTRESMSVKKSDTLFIYKMSLFFMKITKNQNLKLHLAYLPYFFPIWTRVLNHNKYVEIKQFSKVDIKQNNISTVILWIRFLVYQWDPRHLQGSRVVYIFIYTLYSCSI